MPGTVSIPKVFLVILFTLRHRHRSCLAPGDISGAGRAATRPKRRSKSRISARLDRVLRNGKEFCPFRRCWARVFASLGDGLALWHFGQVPVQSPPPKKKERDAMRVWVFQCFVVSVAGFELFQVVIGLALGMVWYCNLSWMLTTEVWILLLLQPFTVDLG